MDILCSTGNHDKAWNDPPVFAYQPTTTGPPQDESGPSQPSTKRTFLNKRVAFPMTANSSSQPTNTATPFGGLPPPLSLPPSGNIQVHFYKHILNTKLNLFFVL